MNDGSKDSEWAHSSSSECHSGLAIGLGIGFWAGWTAWPVQVSNVDTADLKPSAQDYVIILIATRMPSIRIYQTRKPGWPELKDADISARIVTLARKSASENQPYGAHLAALAVALGVRDQELPCSRRPQRATLTENSFADRNSNVHLHSSCDGNNDPAPTITPTHTPTRRATMTRTPTLIPIVPPSWIPALSVWPAAKYEPVYVAAGLKFWHLTKALFCDFKDKHDYCQDLAGGSSDDSTYIMLINANSERTIAPILVTDSAGKSTTDEGINTQKSADDMCNCNYSFQSNFRWRIQVGGAPSDTVSGLGSPIITTCAIF